MSLNFAHYFVFTFCLLKILPSASLSDSLWQNSPFYQTFPENMDHKNPFYMPHSLNYYRHEPTVFLGPSDKKRYNGGGYMGKPFHSKKKKLRGNISHLQRYPLTRKECDGMDNLVMDLGLVSYFIGLAGFIIGIIDLGWSIAGQFFSVTSTWASYISAIPSAIITLSGKSDPFTYIIANVFSAIGIWATVWSHIGLPVGDISIIIGILGEALGLVSLIIGAFATFPKLITDLIQFLVDKEGRDVQIFVDNYRCPN